jgi:hypothetical protein
MDKFIFGMQIKILELVDNFIGVVVSLVTSQLNYANQFHMKSGDGRVRKLNEID